MSYEVILGIFFTACAASGFGSLLGLGGGIILIPALSIFFNIDMRLAVGASLVAIVANSCVATNRNSKLGLYNARLGTMLEFPTIVGSLLGATIVVFVNTSQLYYLFALVVLYVVFQMLRSPLSKSSAEDFVPVKKNRTILLVAFGAGMLSGLLGLAGGVLLVPLMTVFLKRSQHEATATSSYMIGVSGAASAFVFWSRGDVQMWITVPVVLGSMLGALLGSTLLPHVKASVIRYMFMFLCLWMSVQMAWKGYGL